MSLHITFEMGVTLAVLAWLLFGLIKDSPPMSCSSAQSCCWRLSA